MINLAGRSDADIHIRSELTRCGIDIVDVTPGFTEVPYSIVGKLGDFTFKRAWNYWVVTGNVPLAVANALYDDPVGKTDIRVAGHCACPHPSEWIEWKDKDGLDLIPSKEYKKIQSLIADTSSPKAVAFYEGWLEKTRILEEVPEAERRPVISFYHVDSELGLYIFVQTIKSEGLV